MLIGLVCLMDSTLTHIQLSIRLFIVLIIQYGVVIKSKHELWMAEWLYSSSLSESIREYIEPREADESVIPPGRDTGQCWITPQPKQVLIHFTDGGPELSE